MIGRFRPRAARTAVAEQPADLTGAREIAAAFARYDSASLAAVTPHLRAAQLAARWDLWMFVERVWDDARKRGDDPATDPRYAAVAALRDLVCSLYESADEAQRLAGDVDY